MKFCPQCGGPLMTTMQGGRERLTCSAECGYVFWDNPVPVVAAIVELGDSVVLIRNKEWPEKYLGIVAGFLEKDESPESGILRELKEELGLDGEIVGFIGNYAFPQKNQIVLAYHIKAHGEIVLGEELAAWKLVPPSELKPWSMGTGPAVKDWLNRRGFFKGVIMSSVFTKMNLKNEKEIVVLNAPESFLPELAGLKGVKILRDAVKVPEIQYALAFVTKQTEVDAISRAVAPKARGDAQVWFAYPKGTSKKFKCEFNRDNGWAVINSLGWRGIRIVAIDEDWSALRFRRVEYIKSK